MKLINKIGRFTALRRPIFLCILFLLSISLFQNFPGVAHAAGKDWRVAQKKWWHEDEIIEEVIVSYLKILEKYPDLIREAEFDSNIMDLLLLFDSMGSRKSIKTLCSLSSYYLGEHPHEVYSCLLLRKGRSALPFLEALLKSEENECISKFGSKSKTCLDNETYKGELSIIVEQIKRNDSCTIE